MAHSFEYLLEKLDSAEIADDPFPHVYIEDFIAPDDFAALIDSPDIKVAPAHDLDSLFANLDTAGYKPIEFPGCTKSRTEYAEWLQKSVKPKGIHDACEGMGMAMRCTKPASDIVRSLDEFFSSPVTRRVLSDKFGIDAPTTLDCGLQKYLNGYEISPHPDIRQKALTWMLNVNPGADSEQQDIHTHYMKFTGEWDFIRQFWRDNPNAETCWVPWQWCETSKRQVANNSIVIFAPRYDTVHAVRARYDHLPAQRTQFYGNLWYRPVALPFRPRFTDFAAGKAPELDTVEKASRADRLVSAATRAVTKVIDWAPAR
ncbi:MAG: hypothetical protein HYZ38_15635 [Mycobacterium sp.]|nr:hypothetical protein [Mycobacterium sp.]